MIKFLIGTVCDCGNNIIASSNRMQTNITKSCGCIRKEIIDIKFENFKEKEIINLVKPVYNIIYAKNYININEQNEI